MHKSSGSLCAVLLVLLSGCSESSETPVIAAAEAGTAEGGDSASDRGDVLSDKAAEATPTPDVATDVSAEDAGPAGCEDVVSHPTLTHSLGSAADHEKEVATLLALSEADMVALVPTRSGVRWCGCAHCTGGTQEDALDQFEWSIDQPHKLRCKYCGHEYPSSTYPMSDSETGKNALGEDVTYKFYLIKAADRDFWFDAAADYLRRNWFVSQALHLAKAYQLTKKPEYARRAALILQRFAAAYPHMAVLKQWPYKRRHIEEPTPPYPSTGGKWGRWWHDEVPSSLPEVYDLIYSSGALEELSKELNVDVRSQIENDFFRATIDYAFTFGALPADHDSNMAPGTTQRIVNIGRVIQEPSFVHWGYAWVPIMLQNKFLVDGMWPEAISYHYQTAGGIQNVAKALGGYSDPCGYKDPKDGTRLDNVNLQGSFPMLDKAMAAPEIVAYPNGAVCPVHDTWATEHKSDPKTTTVSGLLPAFGHASLGRGSGAEQLQAQLHFSGGHGHQHADNLNFSLFAKGGELASDIGYSHTKLRQWTVSTAGHNTVVIDRKNQATEATTSGDLQVFVPELKGLSAVEATGERGYASATTYRRLLVVVPVSEQEAYVVDLFRVLGGATHDWMLHGSADYDMTAESSLTLTPHKAPDGKDWLLESGETWVEPLGEGSAINPYGVIRSVQEGDTSQLFSVTLRYANSSPVEVAGAGLRTHLSGGSNTRVYLGKSPRVREAEGNDNNVYNFQMPQLVARRTGAAPLSSTYIAVHEPFRTTPWLTSVSLQTLTPSSSTARALEVKHGEFVDTIVVTIDDPPYVARTLASGVSVQGRIAVLRERQGKAEAAWLIDGANITKAGSVVLSLATARYEGTISSISRVASGGATNSFVTAAKLPAGNALSGRWLVLIRGNGQTQGYLIDRVEQDGKNSRLVLSDDPGLELAGTKTTDVFFPKASTTGDNRFVIVEQASL